MILTCCETVHAKVGELPRAWGKRCGGCGRKQPKPEKLTVTAVDREAGVITIGSVRAVRGRGGRRDGR